MSIDQVLTNARIVTPHEVIVGSVRARGGRIVDVVEGRTAVGEDMAGDYLMPGAVELHTDQLEAHFQPRPGVRWDPVTAVLAHDAQMAAAGATTVLDAVRVGTNDDGRPGAGFAARRLADAIESDAASGMLRADHALHLRCEVPAPNCVEQYELFADDPNVRLVSLMDHTPGQRQYASIEVFKRYHIGKHIVEASQIDEYIERLLGVAERYSRPHRVEIAQRAARAGATIATHDDATEEHVREAVELGVQIAEFPTAVAAARAARAAGLAIVMGAPNVVLGGSQSGNIAAEDLLRQGLLDVLSSDYVPASPLQAVFRLAASGALELPEAARLIGDRPARAVGLTDRGRIEPGLRADLVRVRVVAGVPVVRTVWREGERVA